MMTYSSFQSAFMNELENVHTYGSEITVRGSTTRELLMHSFQVLLPSSRVAIIKHRNGNIFAQIAETLWMIAGRDDMDFLERYIPKCRQWSDDGETWRGAYGPRLRKWRGHGSGHGFIMDDYIPVELRYTDQLAQVAHKLNEDPFTRQAVISIWDASSDWVKDSKDYPCNNWLHFIARDDMLHLNVAVRSNDVMFGFSHVDFFGWSVLLQMMAYWTNQHVGTITWNATSFHLYERHWDKAKSILDANRTPLPELVYEHGYRVPIFNTNFLDLDKKFDDLFYIEDMSRRGEWDIAREHWMIAEFDEFLMSCAAMLYAYNAHKNGEPVLAANLIMGLPFIDFRVAAIEYFIRNGKDVISMIGIDSLDNDFLRASAMNL